ncbi:unnamed protein product [Euphydryas editha]|uniref:Uncharacterized protein n=1 Tax=Euphydryas editha TaxID=104508 RepID=A0AAU9VAE3_EUPED|nr:unnamed protein product [Euphydryas editha]
MGSILYKTLIETNALNVDKDDVDKVIEEEITRKLGEDLLQSIERKFQVDLERSVDMILVKIKLLLHNGTQHIQEKLLEIQTTLDTMKSHAENEVEKCLAARYNMTSALAEKALHQMVVCGYALIGQDPEQAVRKVVFLKNMIKDEVKPLHEQKKEIYSILKVCGHDHDSLTKVVKCVISKSPIIKSVMMEITGKLISGVMDLSKLMAHGAMHEACLIEVIKTIEDEAMDVVRDIRKCAFENNTEFDNYIIENNATVLDITNVARERDSENKTSVKAMQDAIDKMLNENNDNSINERFKKKLLNLQNDLNAVDANANIIDVANDLKNIE